MPFNGKSGKFNAAIRTVEIGTGDKAVKLGGECVSPLYSFDAPIENAPKVGVLITDEGFENECESLKAYYAGCANWGEIAQKAAAMEGADFLVLKFDKADPNGENAPVEDCLAIINEVAAATDMPLVIAGCKNAEKDAEIFNKAAEALQGKNVLIFSAKEENYKGVAASAVLAYGQKVGAESSVDINLAKQLNVLISQVGVDMGNIVMNVGTATAGYGFEYVVSTLDRIKAAALGQDDAQLQMPIITSVGDEAWGVKESTASEADVPAWGPVDARGVNMEVTTAMAVLASGSNAVILKHPTSVATVSKLIKELM